MSMPAADNLRYLSQFRLYSTRTAMVEAATLLEAIDALTDESIADDNMDWTIRYANGWTDAMRQVKALLHPDTPT
jgi:hypothetical protein